MYVSGINIRFSLKWCKSLKDKRSFTYSFKSKLQTRFNISISEIDDLNSIKYAHFGIVTISNDFKLVSDRLNKLNEYINKNYFDAEIIEQNQFHLN